MSRNPRSRTIHRISKLLVALGYEPEINSDRHGSYIDVTVDVMDGPTYHVCIELERVDGVPLVRATICLRVQEEDVNVISAIDDVLGEAWQLERISSDDGPCYTLNLTCVTKQEEMAHAWLAGVHLLMVSMTANVCTAIQCIEQVSADVRNECALPGEVVEEHAFVH